jgi:hypothetical protein
MNMNFQTRNEFALHKQTHARCDNARIASVSRPRGFRVKYFLWSAFGLGALYLAAKASLTVVLIIAGVMVGLLAIATAVCVYSQNNTW